MARSTSWGFWSLAEARDRSLLRPRSPCPPGVLYYRSVCYEYLEDAVSWQEAENSCQYWRDGHLASIKSPIEEEKINAYIRSNSKQHTVWIGFRATLVSSKPVWGWSDGFEYIPGSPLWDKNRPVSSSNQCAALCNVQNPSASTRWMQYSCSGTYPYLCKYRAAY
nr:PREDICTED: dromaiocalcin-1-like [Anolis carolinensis]|eukprot:XP_008120567.1 PREDICTED: dromaiocalcin-1-like [Anolis carolinensis]